MESCFDLSIDFDDLVSNRPTTTLRIRKSRLTTERRQFPPPIPLLAQTDRFSPPWALRRHYSGDGRLVLWEERVKRHEYFRAHRSDGRLVLQLVVPLTTDGDDHDSDSDSVGGDAINSEEEEETVSFVEESTVAIDNGKGSAGKCSSYDGGCFVRVPVPAIRTVLT